MSHLKSIGSSSLAERAAWRHIKRSTCERLFESSCWLRHPTPVVGPECPSIVLLTACLVVHPDRICPIHCAQPGTGRTYPIVRLCKRFRSKAKHTKHHSPLAAAAPRSENWRKPSTSLMLPITGSTVHLRSR